MWMGASWVVTSVVLPSVFSPICLFSSGFVWSPSTRCPPNVVNKRNRLSGSYFSSSSSSNLGARVNNEKPTNGSLNNNGVQKGQILEISESKRASSGISVISSIRSRNLAGLSGGTDGDDIYLAFEGGAGTSNLVAVTGETGSGKSLLVSKAADLLTGGRATPSLIHQGTFADASEDSSTTSVEMALMLNNKSHVAMLSSILEEFSLDPIAFLGADDMTLPLSLTLKRSLFISQTTNRVKSVCTINGNGVTLKVLKAVGTPFLAIVDAPAAAAALSRPISRMTMIDTGLPSVVLTWVRQLQTKYTKCRRRREKLEKELATRTLPVSISVNDDGKQDLELLRHWVEELDGFEGRVSNVCQSISNSAPADGSTLGTLMAQFHGLSWEDSDGEFVNAFSSAMYRRLMELSNHLKDLDEKINAATQARDAIGSLSMPDSATTAVERTRSLLHDATAGEQLASPDDSSLSKVSMASERAHQLLNYVEDALNECINFLDDEEKGLLGLLQLERFACIYSHDGIVEFISEWNTLARKHGISPYLLPSCHISLRQELDGNVEARTLLPEALAAEQAALEELEEGCRVLTQARSEMVRRLSTSISSRLPMLGMEASRFEARLRTNSENPTYASGLGVDEVDFLLIHEQDAQQTDLDGGEVDGSHSSQRGGKVEVVASSGEKARILLAIECEIPGSVRALTATTATGSDSSSPSEEMNTVPPVAVIYDEIDAHVGGRASVSVAKMLADQSQSCQVVSITHSPSVAAIADTHIRIQRQPMRGDGRIVSTADAVEGSSRRKELARMASGDMATEEAELFADALLRDAKNQ